MATEGTALPASAKQLHQGGISAGGTRLEAGEVARPKKPRRKGKKKKRKKEEFFYEYTVQKGDTLSLIAHRFDVTVKELCRWNRKATKDPRHLSVGTVLKIYSKVPVRPKRVNYYVVKKGDCLYRIARKLNVTVAQLRDLNSVKGSLIKPGWKLAYLVPGPELESESIGRPSDGRLVNGEKMPRGPGYSYRNRSNVYGTNETITMLIHCIGSYRRKYPDGPDLVLGDISRETGGPLPPHKSHQSGRDVDLGYIHKEEFQPVARLIPTNARNLDVEKTWYLLKCFLDTGQVTVMFMDYEIQKVLYEYLVKRKYKKSYLEKVFQYPRGKGAAALIKHLESHHHHVHIRFKCPPGDKKCIE